MDIQGNAVEPEDFQDDYYCEHGVFIGNPYGADYLCRWCEDGVSKEEFEAELAREFGYRWGGIFALFLLSVKAIQTGIPLELDNANYWNAEFKTLLAIRDAA